MDITPTQLQQLIAAARAAREKAHAVRARFTLGELLPASFGPQHLPPPLP
jgi:hypothetical protein